MYHTSPGWGELAFTSNIQHTSGCFSTLHALRSGTFLKMVSCFMFPSSHKDEADLACYRDFTLMPIICHLSCLALPVSEQGVEIQIDLSLAYCPISSWHRVTKVSQQCLHSSFCIFNPSTHTLFPQLAVTSQILRLAGVFDCILKTLEFLQRCPGEKVKQPIF
jgi:hypothetical protein